MSDENREQKRGDSLDLKVSHALDPYSRQLRYLPYILGGAGVCLLIKAFKPFTKFSSFHEIPAFYISYGIKLKGVVKYVTPCRCLSVEHTPVINVIPALRKSMLLLELPGLDMSTVEQTFIAKKFNDKKIKFKIVGKRTHIPIDSNVTFLEKNNCKDAWGPCLCAETDSSEGKNTSKQTLSSILAAVYVKKGVFHECANIGLVKNGLCKVSSATYSKNMDYLPSFSPFLYQLIKAEERASTKGKGLWSDPMYRTNKSQIVLNYIRDIFMFPVNKLKSSAPVAKIKSWFTRK